MPFTFTFTHMMTRTLLGVMAIVQFSAKYLQCKLFFWVFLFFTFYFYYCYYLVMIKNLTSLAHVQQLACCSCSCTTSDCFRWHNYNSPSAECRDNSGFEAL